MQEKKHVNYVYFAVFFVLISFIHIFQIFLVEGVTLFHRLFYSICAAGQCLLETGVLLVIGNFLQKKFSKRINRLYSVVLFLVLLVHIVDFPLIRIMDMTVWYALDFVMAESFANFIQMLRASNISFTSWIIAGIAGIVLPLIGVVLFHLADRLSTKKPLYFSSSSAGVGLLSVTLLMSIFDYSNEQEMAPAQDGKFIKALPWKTTLFPNPHPTLQLPTALSPKPAENEYLAQVSRFEHVAEKKPNIFLFVIESLREDYVRPEVAPHLTRFGLQCSHFENSISAANATQFSWFSIYHSAYPFYWGARQHWQNGSLPLQILKKAGYKIHVFSSSQLEYYKMNELLLGKDHSLADTYHVYADDDSKEIYQHDADCIEGVLKSLGTESEGNLFLVFLDSTHFDYSFPQEASIFPAPSKIDYFKVACRLGVEGVQNRYKNAVHFIDGLMGQFLEKLETSPGGKEAVVVITGDHGEEFLEQGNIFHASNLSSMQTRIPIYCRLGESLLPDQKIASHIDIFPTILHHVFGKDYFRDWFDGESLLSPRQKSFAISGRYNASRSPFEFLIHDGDHQLIARFDNERDILKAKVLHLISLRDKQNQLIEIRSDQLEQDLQPILKCLLK